MRITRDVITFEEVVDEFIDVGESIDDLSLVRLTCVKDSHFNTISLDLEIFGAGDPDEVGPVLEFSIEPDPLLAEDCPDQGISCQKIPTLFDADLLEDIILRDTPVIWQGEKEIRIHLDDPGNAVLFPMVR